MFHDMLQDLESAKIEFFNKSNNRSFITIAFAQSVDGFLSIDGDQQVMISHHESLVLTHKLRALHDAILVGSITANSDNPRLSVRLTEGNNPQRLVLAKSLNLAKNLLMLNDSEAKPWLFTAEDSCDDKVKSFESKGCKVFKIPYLNSEHLCLNTLFEHTYNQGLKHIMIEGGPTTLQLLRDQKLIDYVIVTQSSQSLKGNDDYQLFVKTDQLSSFDIACNHHQKNRINRWYYGNLLDPFL